MPNPRYFIHIIVAALLIITQTAGLARAEESFSNTQIVRAIWHTEGGRLAHYAYGIRSVRYSSIAEARRICFNTVRNNRKRFADYGHKQYPDFLSFLASRYCPTTGKLSPAERRLNRNWIINLRYFLKKGV